MNNWKCFQEEEEINSLLKKDQDEEIYKIIIENLINFLEKNPKVKHHQNCMGERSWVRVMENRNSNIESSHTVTW